MLQTPLGTSLYEIQTCGANIVRTRPVCIATEPRPMVPTLHCRCIPGCVTCLNYVNHGVYTHIIQARQSWIGCKLNQRGPCTAALRPPHPPPVPLLRIAMGRSTTLEDFTNRRKGPERGGQGSI